MARQVKLAIVGCGGIAGAHLRGWTEIHKHEPDLFEIVAVCDAFAPAAERMAEEIAKWQERKPAVYGDINELLDGAKPDAVDICTPHYLHHVTAVAALERGVHVQVEKPSGLTIKASKRIIEASRKSGAIAATAEQIRRLPPKRVAHWLIHEKKAIGRPLQVFSQLVRYSQPAERNWAWRNERMLSGGGWVLDSGAHFCDTMRYFFGDVESVYARVENLYDRPLNKNGLRVLEEQEDTFVATFNFKSGVIGLWSNACSLPGNDFHQMAIYGSEGAIVEPGQDVFHWPHDKAELRRAGEEPKTMADLFETMLQEIPEARRERWFPHGMHDGFALECYDYAKAVQTGRQVEVELEMGMKAKAMAMAIYESAVTGESVYVDDVLDGSLDAYEAPLNERWGI
ncbi:MAG TPA: Gfo/Idh/MocA family oxidoreductase [Limnochordia bacterium]|nr:Gfo/Idh/MocA family oxidoreductase [Limnochordia bacterium]